MLLRQSIKQSLSQKIDPKIILANSILACSTLELDESIEQEIAENPALELPDDDLCANCSYPKEMCADCPMRAQQAKDADLEEFDWRDFYTLDLDSFESQPSDDEDYDPFANICSHRSLQEYLVEQLRGSVAAELFPAGEYLIGCINNSGYLEGELDEMSADSGWSLETLQDALKAIQSLDPPGVGARSLQECLLIQLRGMEDQPDIARLALRMVESHWSDVSAHRISRIAHQLRVSEHAVRTAMTFITQRLQPYPGESYRQPWDSQDSSSAVRPDIIVRRTLAGYDIDVVVSERQLLAINARYRDAYNRIRNGGSRTFSTDERRHIVEYVERADMFIRSIAQRRKTLKLITRYVVECQQGYIETGLPSFLRPLTRTQVARAIGMHESTVSRATANKWVLLPSEEVVTFDLFFDGSRSVKDMIASIIAQEDPARPLSDQEIAGILQERGLDVARRTVVKYREAMNILSSRQRRRAS